MTFIRRYLTDPGNAELTAIEGVVIIDREGPADISGVGSGCALLVGEFENGPFNTPTELVSGEDLLRTFGGFGFTYQGVPSNNPCARTRRPDLSVRDQYWNGNGFVALTNKKFRRLIVCRVDTNVGAVEFSRLAFVTGGAGFTFPLTTGQILAFDLGAGAVTSTFTGALATQNSAAGTYPTTFVGGESLTFTIDEGTPQQVGPVTAVFKATDTSQALVVARLNSYAGYTAFAVGGGNVTSITGRVGGTSGNVRINAVSGALVTTATGFSAGAAVAGTGNVANINQVTPAEVASIVLAASTSTIRVQVDANGRLRASNLNPLAGQDITVHASTTALNLGFVIGDTNDNSVGTAGTIPAGTRVRNAGGEEWVTMQDVEVLATNSGPYSVKVRPADDDGGTPLAATNTVNVVPYPIELGSFAVVNPLPLSAALSEVAIDARYTTAIDATLAANAISKEANLIASARTSNAVNTRIKGNAIQASAEGLFGRVACISPPLGITTRAQALSESLQPGVGAYRDQRVVYNFPGAATFVPQVAARGLAGGAGFSADGVIDVTSNTWLMSVASQLPPEENPGQDTGFITEIIGVERGNADVQDLRIGDYRNFKAKGICALRMDGAEAIFQSGVTSVDPAVNPNLKNIARRRMADFIQDSLAQRAKSFSKKLSTKVRRATILAETDAFLEDLVSPGNPGAQRIDSFSTDAKSGNTPSSLALGIFRIIVKVRSLSSLDVIVYDIEVGESTITVSEAA